MSTKNMSPSSGKYYNSAGELTYLMDTGTTAADSPSANMLPFTGDFYASDGTVHNIDELGGGGGGTEHGIPAGGTTGQALTKTSDANYAAGWTDQPFVKLVSEETQILETDLAIGKGQKFLLERPDGRQENAIFVGVYNTYEQEEIASMADPTCINHNAKATDGTVVGKNVLVNYRDEEGVAQDAQIAYLEDLDGKLDKITDTKSSARVYTISPAGAQTTTNVSSSLVASAIAQRDGLGRLQTPAPANVNDAVNKDYVDSNFLRTSAGLQWKSLWTGNWTMGPIDVEYNSYPVYLIQTSGGQMVGYRVGDIVNASGVRSLSDGTVYTLTATFRVSGYSWTWDSSYPPRYLQHDPGGSHSLSGTVPVSAIYALAF